MTKNLLHNTNKPAEFRSQSEDKILSLFNALREVDSEGTHAWAEKIDCDVEELFSRWEIYDFSVNKDADTGLVLDCKSVRYGSVIVKIYPPFLRGRFLNESYILKHLAGYPQVALLDQVDSKNAMLIERIIPGDYISYPEDKENIEKLFLVIYHNRVASSKNIPDGIIGVTEMTKSEYQVSSGYDYHKETLSYLVEQADRIYQLCFEQDGKFLLHGDIYFKNALNSNDGIQLIDPLGYNDAFLFEYMPFLTYELYSHTLQEDYVAKYVELIAFFRNITDVRLFPEAIFVFLVKQLIPSVYYYNDHFKRADTFLNIIKVLFLNDEGRLDMKKVDLTVIDRP